MSYAEARGICPNSRVLPGSGRRPRERTARLRKRPAFGIRPCAEPPARLQEIPIEWPDNGFMFLTPGSLKDLLPFIERITRGPGRTLVGNALVVNGLLVALVFALGGDAGTFLRALLGAVSAFGLVSALVFAWRRKRLKDAVDRWQESSGQVVASASDSRPEGAERRTDEGDVGKGQNGPGGVDECDSPSQEIVVIDQSGRRESAPPPKDAFADSEETIERDRLHDAAAEAAQLRETWMPRIEAAQRSAIAAAGGLVNAPYLKDDLRVTLLSGIFTLLSIPLGVFFTFVAFLTLVF